MSRRVAGVDLGKAGIKLVIAAFDERGARVEHAEHASHEGRPLEALAELYRDRQLGSLDALGVTGVHGDSLVAPALGGLPEDACLEAALGARPDLVGPLNLVSVGARGYAVLARDASGRVHYVENDKCSSGTGETMVKTALRFGLSLEEADRIAAAAAASDAIPITARCSVFAKSEMTHYGNQGEPADRLFRGYFDSIARYVAALLGRVRVPGPVLLVGGGSRLSALRACLSAQLGTEVIVPDGALLLEALGAAVLAAGGERAALPADPEPLLQRKQRRIETLEPARHAAGRVTQLAAPPVADAARNEPCVLGLDLGSTGSKAALTSIESGELVLDVYDRTRGNPVEAAQRLVRTLLQQAAPDVRAIGVTGSGREAVATVLRAAFAQAADRIVVLNEIVAHATAAIRCDPDGGRSLSVVEIGGQDAKFIQIADGQIIESDLNKACSAGTGSFLEEQALLYGCSEIEEFTRLAQQAGSPPNLGQMCTVFVAETAAEARAEGFSVPDLFAGFQYSVVHNYLNRVMGQRSFGERIFFQGKPASGASLAWTLAAVSDREVFVPPNPGAMGAWGIGLAAIGELGAETLEHAARLDVARLLDARIAGKQEFRCDDKRCATLCRIERATVTIGDGKQTVFSGGACPKFEVARAGRAKLPADAPSPFDDREALLAPFLEPTPGARTVAVPYVGSLVGWLPWVVTFLRKLGLGVRVLAPDARALSRGEERSSAYDSCAPLKIAQGVIDGDMDTLFFPRLLDLLDRDHGPGKTCSTEQAMPVVIQQWLKAREIELPVVMPVLELGAGLTTPSLVLALASAARELGADPVRAVSAAHRAAEARQSYERELSAIGRRALSYARARALPIVVVCGSLHVLFDRTLNAGIPGILRQNGAIPLPMDCFPIPAEIDPLERIVWAESRRALRTALAARASGDLYPLLLSSFGCGPASFVEQIFEHLMRGYPHTALESDGHGGNAGFVTRVQAFLHGVRQYGRKRSPVPRRRLELLQPIAPTPLADDQDAQLVVISVAQNLSELAAASYRSLGYDAISAGTSSAEHLAIGRRDCSGKECLPYQIVWGGFKKQVENQEPGRRSVLVQVTGQGACRNCLFSIKDRLSLEHSGLSGRATVRHLGSEKELKSSFFTRFWGATLGWDVLHQLAAYFRAGNDPDRIDRLHHDHEQRLIALVGKRRPNGVRAWLGLNDHVREIESVVLDAARDFAALGSEGDFRTVFLAGDIYVRIDDFANDGLVRALAARGLRVVVEPVNAFVEYLSYERSAELLGLPTGFVENALGDRALRATRDRLYERVRALHPWLPLPDVRRSLQAARPVIDRWPLGEAPVTVGAVLDAWGEGVCDGVVLASPWGCGPALVTESLLRHRREIPTLFLYSDGSPRDDRRLNAFAHRMFKNPPRTRAAAPAVA
jgi:activator of 2-hydroxyglutaryl-CoA dehydratase/predicted nucleotide-binding protein (sugar kinase/HSP70/actin superfamily)